MSEVNRGFSPDLAKKIRQEAHPNYIGGSARGEATRSVAKGIDQAILAMMPKELKPLFSKRAAESARHHERQVRAEAGRSRPHAESKGQFRMQRLSGEPSRIGSAYRSEARTKTQGLTAARSELASLRMQAEHQAHFATQRKDASARDRYGAYYTRVMTTKPENNPHYQPGKAAKKAA